MANDVNATGIVRDERVVVGVQQAAADTRGAAGWVALVEDDHARSRPRPSRSAPSRRSCSCRAGSARSCPSWSPGRSRPEVQPLAELGVCGRRAGRCRPPAGCRRSAVAVARPGVPVGDEREAARRRGGLAPRRRADEGGVGELVRLELTSYPARLHPALHVQGRLPGSPARRSCATDGRPGPGWRRRSSGTPACAPRAHRSGCRAAACAGVSLTRASHCLAVIALALLGARRPTATMSETRHAGATRRLVSTDMKPSPLG